MSEIEGMIKDDRKYVHTVWQTPEDASDTYTITIKVDKGNNNVDLDDLDEYNEYNNEASRALRFEGEWKVDPYQVGPFEFPEDGGEHDLNDNDGSHKHEWWFAVGHVDGNGDGDYEYAYMICFFYDINDNGMMIIKITDVNADYSYHKVYTDNDFTSIDPSADDLSLSYIVDSQDDQFGPYTNTFQRTGLYDYHIHVYAESENEEGHPSQYIEIDLTLEAVKSPLLIDGDGRIKMGYGFPDESDQYSDYYSQTRLIISNSDVSRIRIGDADDDYKEVIINNGISFIDRQWGFWRFKDDPQADGNYYDGYDWYAIQLGDTEETQIELNIYNMHEKITRNTITSQAVVCYPDNSMDTTYEFIITPLDSWESPSTEIVYSQEWRIKIPDLNLYLKIEPKVDRQEDYFITQAMTIGLWEGACTVTGFLDGESINGDSFTEIPASSEHSSFLYEIFDIV